jgi:hypothetical protein
MARATQDSPTSGLAAAKPVSGRLVGFTRALAAGAATARGLAVVVPAGLIVTALVVAAPVLGASAAHHSLTSMYDQGRRITVTGVVREFRFVSPHPWVVVDSTEDGRQRSWRSELDNLFELSAVGMTAETLKPGDRVVVTGSPARGGADGLYVRQLDRAADGFRYEQVGSSPRVRFVPR